MSILVTGGAGYIGSHTVVELVKENHDIVIIDNLINSNSEVINRIENITGEKITTYFFDLLNKESLEQIFNAHNIDSVIHFAGFKAVGESVSNPLKYYSNNLLSTINLCECMEKFNVYNLIFQLFGHRIWYY